MVDCVLSSFFSLCVCHVFHLSGERVTFTIIAPDKEGVDTAVATPDREGMDRAAVTPDREGVDTAAVTQSQGGLCHMWLTQMVQTQKYQCGQVWGQYSDKREALTLMDKKSARIMPAKEPRE